MVFPSETTFSISGVRPGAVKINFSPKTRGQKTLEVLRDGQDVLKSGMEIKPGEVAGNLAIVIGASGAATQPVAQPAIEGAQASKAGLPDGVAAVAPVK